VNGAGDVEKRGALAWARCIHCGGWLPVSAALRAAPAIALHCPHCLRDLPQPEVREWTGPGSAG